MTCDVCRTSAVVWQHAEGALCDVCKRSIERGEGGYARYPLPTDLRHEPNGSFQLVPFPDGVGMTLRWVPT
jgi:hypothetical protein